MQVPATTILVSQALRDFGCHVSGQVVQHDVHNQPARDAAVDLFEKPQHVSAHMGLAQFGEDFADADVHRREQIDGAVPLVVMSHRLRATTLHRNDGWVRSRAWRCVFSSTLNTTARAGERRYADTRQATASDSY